MSKDSVPHVPAADVSWDNHDRVIIRNADFVRSLVEQGHIWASPVVVIEATFVDPADRAMAVRKGHTHLDEVGEVLRTLGPDRLPAHIVLKHFSMKCTVDEVAAGIARSIPDFARDRIRVLLQGPFSST